MSNVKVSIPAKLSVDPLFLDVLSFSAVEMFNFNVDALKHFNYKHVEVYQHPENGYIFAKGTLPVCLVAHMDKVPWYKPIKKISKTPVLNKKGDVSDVYLSSKQGIGGDDRCGVYAILSMLKIGHRPSVLFCMGEEIGCRGSRKFTEDHKKNFLKDINAFIQIDRRGSNDCVRYSDHNHNLTDKICEFGYVSAFGSMSDISILMPHFGISGVNLSSGYYHEHHANLEYVSVKDVKVLLRRLNKILSSNIFTERFEYQSYSSYGYCDSRYGLDSFKKFNFQKPMSDLEKSSSKQLSLFEDIPYESPDDLAVCDYCGESFHEADLIETDNIMIGNVCEDCAKEMIKSGYVKCSCCGKLYLPSKDNSNCPFCGSVYVSDKDI